MGFKRKSSKLAFDHLFNMTATDLGQALRLPARAIVQASRTPRDPGRAAGLTRFQGEAMADVSRLDGN